MATAARPPGLLRYTPNVLSGARLVAVPARLIARLFGLESRLGAVLDSVADTGLMFVSVYGIWVFYPEVLREHAWLCGSAVGLWLLEDLLALARYGRLSSFHTYLSKIVANVLGVFIGWLFLFGFEPWLLYLAAGMSIVASLEELALLAVLPKWRADVRGLWWVLREDRGR